MKNIKVYSQAGRGRFFNQGVKGPWGVVVSVGLFDPL